MLVKNHVYRITKALSKNANQRQAIELAKYSLSRAKGSKLKLNLFYTIESGYRIDIYQSHALGDGVYYCKWLKTVGDAVTTFNDYLKAWYAAMPN